MTLPITDDLADKLQSLLLYDPSSPLIFNNERMAIPAIVYALVMNVVLLLYLRVLQRGDRLRAGAGR